jgi:hypothetical protein
VHQCESRGGVGSARRFLRCTRHNAALNKHRSIGRKWVRCRSPAPTICMVDDCDRSMFAFSHGSASADVLSARDSLPAAICYGM